MASLIYNSYGTKLFDNTTKIDWSSNTFKLALTTSSYIPDRTTHDFFNDITNEVSGTGYTAGGMALGSITVTQDNVNNRIVIDAADTTWAASTITNARYGILYKDTGVSSTSPLVALIDFGTNRSSSNSSFTVQWNTSGIIRLSL